jgi:hypothetical protein
MAYSSFAADLYLSASDLCAPGTLTAVEGDLFGVLVASNNGYGYCHSAHRRGGAGHAGRCGADARRRHSSHLTDTHTLANPRFAPKILAHAGRHAGTKIIRTHAERLVGTTMLDIVAVIAEQALGNTINNVAQTPVDPALEQAAQQCAAFTVEAR